MILEVKNCFVAFAVLVSKDCGLRIKLTFDFDLFQSFFGYQES